MRGQYKERKRRN